MSAFNQPAAEPSVVATADLSPWVAISSCLRGDHKRGCGRGQYLGRWPVFVRWCDVHDTHSGRDVGEAERDPQRELETLNAMAGTGVPQSIGAFEVGGKRVVASAWIDGGDMTSVSPRRPDVFARQIVSVLLRAHRQGLVHGDVKPSNMILDSLGRAFLVDWAGSAQVGERCHPGTLGYAPAWAWTPDHRAHPDDDLYALAVSMWEIVHGSRAFSGGDRSTIIRTQQERGLQWLSEGMPVYLEHLLGAAKERRFADFVSFHDSLDTSDALDSILTQKLPPHEAAKKVAADVVAHRSDGFIHVRARVAPSDVDAFVDQAVERIQMSRRNCVKWRDLLGAVLPIETSPPATSSTSRIDSIRDVSRQAVQSAMQWISGAGNLTVVCSEHENDGLLESTWWQLGKTLAITPLTGVTLVTVSGMVEFAFSRVERREVVRSMIISAFPGVFIPETVLDRLSDVDANSFVGLRRVVSEFVAANVLRRDAGAGVMEFAPLARGMHGYVKEAVDEVAQPLQVAEFAVIRGDIVCAVKVALRIQADAQALAIDHIRRLADVWLECGRPEAARECCNLIPQSRWDFDDLMRASRVAIVTGDTNALIQYANSGRELTRVLDDEVEIMRLTALAALAKQDTVSAIEMLRPALRLRKCGASERSIAWILVSLGNGLRMAGRIPSAGRALRCARQLANSLRSVRLSAVVDANLLQTATGRRNPTVVAKEATALAAQCACWGMSQEHVTVTLTAAAWWLIAREPQAACAVLDPAVAQVALGLGVSTRVAELLETRWAEAHDLAEHWVTIESLAAVASTKRLGSRPWLHGMLLAAEVSGDDSFLSIKKRESDVDLEARAARVVTNGTLRADRRRGRFIRLLQVLAATIASDSPLCGHIARVVVRRAVKHGGLHELLCECAQLWGVSNDDGSTVRRAIGIIGLAFLANDQELTRLLGDIWDGDVRTRPPGTREWEWRFAAEVICGQPGWVGRTPDLEGLLVTIEGTLASMSPSTARSYRSGVPLGSLFQLVGDVDEPRRTALESSELSGDPVSLSGVRASLFRCARGGAVVNGRVAGLERVLAGALRLRSESDVDLLVSEIASGVLAVCMAERAVVMYEDDRRISRAKVASEGGVIVIASQSAEVSKTVLDRVRKSGRALVIDDACGDNDLCERPSVQAFRPRSLIVAPLMVQEKYLGYIYVENRSVSRSFSESDAQLVEGFAAQAALALENARLVEDLRRSCRDLEQARTEAVRAESLRVLGRMASEIAHDFNNLLTAIIGETQLLMQDPALHGFRSSVGVIERAALDGASAIRRIQDSTRIRTDVPSEVFDICHVVHAPPWSGRRSPDSREPPVRIWSRSAWIAGRSA
jgi:GAF domain-containing protein/serine/threonine protein kinase